jgi:hypothetical protein
MISGYRSNNGLGPVIIDADPMRLASEQARAMAARGLEKSWRSQHRSVGIFD